MKAQRILHLLKSFESNFLFNLHVTTIESGVFDAYTLMALSANWLLSLSLTNRRVWFQHDARSTQPPVETWPQHTHIHTPAPQIHMIQCISTEGFVGQVWSWMWDKQLCGRLNQEGGARLSQGWVCYSLGVRARPELAHTHPGATDITAMTIYLKYFLYVPLQDNAMIFMPWN